MNSTLHAEDVSFEQVLVLAQRLRPTDQARLAALLASAVTTVLDQAAHGSSPTGRKPLRSMLADLGKAPSSEEIDEVQRAMW